MYQCTYDKPNDVLAAVVSERMPCVQMIYSTRKDAIFKCVVKAEVI